MSSQLVHDMPTDVVSSLAAAMGSDQGAEAVAQSATPDLGLDDILARHLVRSVYQPIVDLDSGAVVGYEALARGPEGTPFARPDVLFAAARAAGRLAELDLSCRIAAVSGAVDAQLAAPWTLFVNVEPETAETALNSHPLSAGYLGHDAAGLRIVMEITERALVSDPTQLLQLVERIRARGWGIALDDLGADRNSLALLPMLRPDVIKLDLSLIQKRADSEVAEIVSAVRAEAERSGTLVLAEGIETQQHLETARAMGASLGQGWMLGRPGPLPSTAGVFHGSQIVIVNQARQLLNDAPFHLGAALITPRLARKTLLIEISKHFERQAIVSGESTVVLASFQEAAFFTKATRLRFAELVDNAAFVGVLGHNMPAQPMPGVRGGLLDRDDPLIGEWDIAVVGPHFAATLLARDLGDQGPDAERRFEFVLSHNRELAITVAACLMSRIQPLP